MIDQGILPVQNRGIASETGQRCASDTCKNHANGSRSDKTLIKGLPGPFRERKITGEQLCDYTD